MFALLRRVLGIRVLVSKDEALRIAKTHCLSQSWPWLDPVHGVLAVRSYTFITNASFKGGNVTIRVDCSTGAVTSAAYANR